MENQNQEKAARAIGRVAVIGCGRWGSLITWYLSACRWLDVTLYGRPDSAHMQRFLRERRNDLLTLPDSVQLQVSGSIIKNVKSVIVPNTGHLKGMEAAVAAGIIAGSAEKELEVISEVSEEKKSAIRDYLQTVPITIEHTEQGHVFDIVVTERCGQDYARVRIADYHTNICRIEKNGTVLYEVPLLDETVQEDARADRSLLNMQDIWDFAETAALRELFGLTAIPPFQAWLEKMGFVENGRLTPKAGEGSALL